jgi:Tol biopolymer transport system component
MDASRATTDRLGHFSDHVLATGRGSGFNRPTMLPGTIQPTVNGEPAAEARLSPDGTWVAFSQRGSVFVAMAEEGDLTADSAERVFAAEGEHAADLAWSTDGQWLAFTLTGGPPPGEVRIAAVRVWKKSSVERPGMSFAWAGSTLVIADPTAARVYLNDLDLGVEPTVCEITDDGDPHFPPVLAVSPDARQIAVVTRRVGDDVTRVQLARHDGRAWTAAVLTEISGTSLRIFPFWTADSAAMALYVVDLAANHTTIVAIPERDGDGDVLYTSDSVDAAITPAVHPDGRLIALVRVLDGRHRLVLLDPVEHAVAPIAAEGIVGKLRWADDRTLVVEGRGVWTVRLRAGEPEPAATAPDDAMIRVVVQDRDPARSFACRVPRGWKRVPLPDGEPDFADPGAVRPLCLFAPAHAAMVFTVSARPAIDQMDCAAILTYLAEQQGMRTGAVTASRNRAATEAVQDATRFRLAVVEHAGWFYTVAAGAPDPLWDSVKDLLNRAVDSVEFPD